MGVGRWMLVVCALAAACQHGDPRTGPPAPGPVQSPSADPTPGPGDTRSPRQRPAPAEATLGVRDRGVFSDLDGRVQLRLPPRLPDGRTTVVVSPRHATAVVMIDDRPIKVYPTGGPATLALDATTVRMRPGDRDELHGSLGTAAPMVLTVADDETLPGGDRDDDGIPDRLDLLVGAHKTAVNGAAYDAGYYSIRYPGGDVDREIGACTDVVIRAARNAGVDLQAAIARDIKRNPDAYPMVRKRDRNIDHRRVRTMLPYFRRHFEAHGTSIDDPADPILPGDIVFMDTLARAGPDHIGIVSDEHSPGGVPLVINNWTDGAHTTPMELLSWVPVTHRFRWPADPKSKWRLPAAIRRVVVVTTGGWEDWHGQVRRFERRGRRFRRVGNVEPAVIGQAGFGWGRGLHEGAPGLRVGPRKHEGDGRSPAGVFAIGDAFGKAPAASVGVRVPYTQVTPTLRCVDDPRSPNYGSWVDTAAAPLQAKSSEAMLRSDALYDLGLVIEHNQPAKAGDGSCIFFHVWHDADSPLIGCTGLDADAMQTLAGWVQPDHTAVVALPLPTYRRLQSVWGLPAL